MTSHKGAVEPWTSTMSIFVLSVVYRTDPTSWDTYSSFTVLAPNESEARKACLRKIGEFHAPMYLRTDSVIPVPTQTTILSTELLSV